MTDEEYEELLDIYHEFKEKAQAKGCYIYEATTAKDANNYILKVCQKHNSQIVVKSKSMTSEEIKLNDFLEKNHISSIETDLGEWILQLAKESPSHMVMPAIHKSRQQVAELFTNVLQKNVDPNDIQTMVNIARTELRNYFFQAKVGITGANVAVAETATVGIVTNEGNARLLTTIPDVHIVLLGYEKLVKTFKEALQIIRALPKSATGQIISSYVSWITGSYLGKHGEKEVHFVFLDNGRLPLFKNKALKEALKCIKCGSCANVCPVYKLVGGHIFGDTYVGAIGLILASFYGDEKKANEILKLCIGCKSCSVNCPAGIDLQRLISDINLAITPKYGLDRSKKILFSYITPNPYIFNTAVKIGKYIQKPLQNDKQLKNIPLTKHNFKIFPSIPNYNFREAYKNFYSNKNNKIYKRKKMLFYSGCAIEYIFPEIGLSLLKILSKFNLKIETPSKTICCGLPAIHYGDIKGAQKNILKNIKHLNDDYEDIIILCPSCGTTIKNEFKKYIYNSPQDYKKIIKISQKIKSLSQFIAENNLKFKYTKEYRITYHTPCHQKHGLNFSSEEILAKITGKYFMPLKDTDVCCGFGGTFSFDFPEISSQILEEKISNIVETGAQIVVTDCPGCIMQIRGGLLKKQIPIKVMHLSDFLNFYTEISN